MTYKKPQTKFIKVDADQNKGEFIKVGVWRVAPKDHWGE